MSTHTVNIIEIEQVLPHENAERLELVPVAGWQAVVKKGDFKPGDKAIYIEPDYTVPTTRPEFAFLARDGKERHRLKAVRLRGVLSYGLLIPVPAELANASVGDNVMEALGIRRWEPEVKAHTSGDRLAEAEWPKTYTPVFNVESYQRFPGAFRRNEQVVVTEKIHGANARYVWVDGVFYMGSRNHWLRDGDHIWARAATIGTGIRTWCEVNAGTVLYGEVYGNVQSLKYGLDRGAVAFSAFAAIKNGCWVDQTELFRTLASAGVRTAPIVYEGPFDIETIKNVAEEDSRVAGVPGHMMEGVVIVPSQERFDSNFGGRVALKLISNRYWESNE